MRLARTIVVSACSVYLAVATLLYVFQRELMYLPDHRERVSIEAVDGLAGLREIEVRTEDGLRLYAWYAPAPPDRPTVLLFHGNNGSLPSQRIRIAKFRDAGFGVMALAFRGFSGSEGHPSEHGLYKDARAALDWLNAHGVANEQIALYGESLGTGVAIKMASERNVALVALEAPYTSMVDVGHWLFPLMPMREFLRDRYDALPLAEKIRAPVLVMHGAEDTVIPQPLGRMLFDAIKAPKEGYWPEGVGHLDMFEKGGCEVARDFIERHFVAPSERRPLAGAVKIPVG